MLSGARDLILLMVSFISFKGSSVFPLALFLVDGSGTYFRLLFSAGDLVDEGVDLMEEGEELSFLFRSSSSTSFS